MSIQIQKTLNNHSKYLYRNKQTPIQNHYATNQNIVSIHLKDKLIQVSDEIKTKSKRGRKKKNEVIGEEINLKKNKIEEKSAQKEQEYNETIDYLCEVQYREMQERAWSMINFSQSKQKNQDPVTNDSQIIQNNQILKQENQNHQNQIRRFLYPSCINKSYNNFYGYFGHASVLTSRPVIQGTYFIEFKILSHSINKVNKAWFQSLNKNFKQDPKELKTAVRIGIASLDYNLLTPLGGQYSYALKGLDGSIMNNKNTMNQADNAKFGIGDVVGILLHMEPPIPISKKEKKNFKDFVNKGSRLQFFRNGTKISQIFDLTQRFYVFGVSMYNWANISINSGPKFEFPPTPIHKPYSCIYSEDIIYKDLKFE